MFKRYSACIDKERGNHNKKCNNILILCAKTRGLALY